MTAEKHADFTERLTACGMSQSEFIRQAITGPVCFYKDAVLDIGKAADFLCENCLNEILPLHPERCFGVGAVNLATKDVCIFAEDLGGFTLGDFYINCSLQNKDGGQLRMDLVIFYCPIRYEKEP